jgi:hypothetical protein
MGCIIIDNPMRQMEEIEGGPEEIAEDMFEEEAGETAKETAGKMAKEMARKTAKVMVGEMVDVAAGAIAEEGEEPIGALSDKKTLRGLRNLLAELMTKESQFVIIVALQHTAFGIVLKRKRRMVVKSLDRIPGSRRQKSKKSQLLLI